MDYSALISTANLKDGVTYMYNDQTQSLDLFIDETDCKKQGPICNGCGEVYTCIPIGNAWIIEKLYDCDTKNGYTCLESTASCTLEHNPDCPVEVDGYKFVCHQTGLFPDAFDCQKYHLCIPTSSDDPRPEPESIPLTCSSGYYYNAKTGVCSKKLTSNGNCPAPAPLCANLGQTGNISGNAALYYVCMKVNPTDVLFFPQMFVCGGGKEFNTTQKVCVDNSPQLATGTDGKCIQKGFFYDPTNCFYYYECSAAAVNPVRRACPSKTHFNYKTHACEDFTCQDLENTHNGASVQYSCSNGV